MSRLCVIDSTDGLCIQVYVYEGTPPSITLDPPYEIAPNGDGEVGWTWNGSVWIDPSDFEGNDGVEIPLDSFLLYRKVIMLSPNLYILEEFFQSTGEFVLRDGLLGVEYLIQGGGGSSQYLTAVTSSGYIKSSAGGSGGGYIYGYASIADCEAAATNGVIDVTVGLGGLIDDTLNGYGNNGGSSSFGSIATAEGGLKPETGAEQINTATFRRGSLGGLGYGEGLIRPGSAGKNAIILNGTTAMGGDGGDSFMGVGGKGRSYFEGGGGISTSLHGVGYGSGGGGMTLAYSQSSAAGGDGANGCVILRGYYENDPSS